MRILLPSVMFAVLGVGGVDGKAALGTKEYEEELHHRNLANTNKPKQAFVTDVNGATGPMNGRALPARRNGDATKPTKPQPQTASASPKKTPHTASAASPGEKKAPAGAGKAPPKPQGAAPLDGSASPQSVQKKTAPKPHDANTAPKKQHGPAGAGEKQAPKKGGETKPHLGPSSGSGSGAGPAPNAIDTHIVGGDDADVNEYPYFGKSFGCVSLLAFPCLFDESTDIKCTDFFLP